MLLRFFLFAIRLLSLLICYVHKVHVRVMYLSFIACTEVRDCVWVAFTCVPMIRLVHCSGAPCPTGMCWCVLRADSTASSFNCRACNSLSTFTRDETLAAWRGTEDCTFTGVEDCTFAEACTHPSCWPAEKQKELRRMCRCRCVREFLNPLDLNIGLG